MTKQLFDRLRTRTVAFLHDLLMVPIAWCGAYWLRFNLEKIPDEFWERALALLPVLLLVHAMMFVYFGLYRGVWRFASMPDFVRIGKAVVAAVIISMVLVLMWSRLELVPRSVFILHGLLLLLLLGLPRFGYRWMKDHKLYHPASTRVLIVGAGGTGEMLARELLHNTEGYQLVAFLDDNIRKIGTEVHGIRVVADCQAIPQIVDGYSIDLILIAIPNATPEVMRRIVNGCEASGKPFRTLPRLLDILSGRTILQEFREVSIDDLLGREPVSLDWQTIRHKLAGRTVLISGGGGSIGSELCRQVASLEPAALIILEHSEFNLYQIDRELRARFPGLRLYAHLCDVCDTVTVEHLLTRYHPEVIFHAAAYKHVPLLEQQVCETLHNNLFGTMNLATIANDHGCRKFVLISTDKSVNPTSIMGVSKHLAEVYCQNFNQFSSTRFVTVRFGNVMDSAGSVIPLFREQIRAGGPVTVTHPEITRYFMTIPEASQLIMQAGAVGQGGEIYVLDMGEPISIRYLAEQMIRLSGKLPGQDIGIEYTGLRAGEKLYEELFNEGEDLLPTPYPKLYLARSRAVNWRQFNHTLTLLLEACNRYDEEQLRCLLKTLVPQFQESNTPPALAANG